MPADLEPSAEVLRALRLTNTQFQIGLALATMPEGVTPLTLQTTYAVSDGEVEELVERGFISWTGEHYHATAMGAGLLKAIADYVAAMR